MQRDDIGVRRQSLQGLDLSQVVNLCYFYFSSINYLVNIVEMGFHAFDCNVFACFD